MYTKEAIFSNKQYNILHIKNCILKLKKVIVDGSWLQVSAPAAPMPLVAWFDTKITQKNNSFFIIACERAAVPSSYKFFAIFFRVNSFLIRIIFWIIL